MFYSESDLLHTVNHLTSQLSVKLGPSHITLVVHFDLDLQISSFVSQRECYLARVIPFDSLSFMLLTTTVFQSLPKQNDCIWFQADRRRRIQFYPANRYNINVSLDSF